MATEIFTNQPSTTVSGGGTTAPAGGTVETWTVGSSGSFPAASSSATPPTQFHVIDKATGKTSEIIAVTNVSGTTWTVTRGAEATTPVTHTAGFAVTQVVTAGGLNAFPNPSNTPAVYNVKGYGATGNGVTSDKTAVQNAVAAALAAGGGTVFFPPGTYVMYNVTFGSNLIVQGSGPQGSNYADTGGTVLLMDPAAPSGAVVCRVGPASAVAIVEYCSVRDLTIDGNKATWGASSDQKGYGYYMGQSNPGLLFNNSMYNVEIRNCMTYAFDIERATYTTLVNCDCHDNGYAAGTGAHVNADGFTLIGDDITCVGCRSWNNAIFGFRGGQSANQWHRVQLIGCEAWSNGQVGASLGADSTPGDYLLDSAIIGGAYYSNGTDSSGGTRAGVYLNSGAISCTVQGATVYNNATSGIIVSGGTNCSVNGNMVNDNATAVASSPEIILTNTTTYTTVTGNNVKSSNATHAISEQAGGTTNFNLITGNTVASTSTTIVVNGANSYAYGNLGGNTTLDTVPAPAASLSLNSQKITNLLNGAATQDGAAFGQIPGNWGPADQGLIAWNFDGPGGASGGNTALATAGTIYTMAVKLPIAKSITNIVVELVTSGGTLTTGQCFAALYQGAGGARLGVTADQASAWGAGAPKAVTMAIAGGPVAAAAGTLIVGLWFNGTTGPAFLRSSGTQTLMNVGLAAAASRWGTADTGLTTTAPSPLGTISAAGVAYWVGLS